MVQSERKAADVCPSDPPFVKNLGRSDFAKSQLVAISAMLGAREQLQKSQRKGCFLASRHGHHLPLNGEPTVDRRE